MRLQATLAALLVSTVAAGSLRRQLAAGASTINGEESLQSDIESLRAGTSFADQAITANVLHDAVAGLGLEKTASALNVNVGGGIDISADTVVLANTIAGDGLALNAGVLSVAGGSITRNMLHADMPGSTICDGTAGTGAVGSDTWYKPGQSSPCYEFDCVQLTEIGDVTAGGGIIEGGSDTNPGLVWDPAGGEHSCPSDTDPLIFSADAQQAEIDDYLAEVSNAAGNTLTNAKPIWYEKSDGSGGSTKHAWTGQGEIDGRGFGDVSNFHDPTSVSNDVKLALCIQKEKTGSVTFGYTRTGGHKLAQLVEVEAFCLKYSDIVAANVTP